MGRSFFAFSNAVEQIMKDLNIDNMLSNMMTKEEVNKPAESTKNNINNLKQYD